MTFYKEFKKFISRGNAIDLAVGVIIRKAKRCGHCTSELETKI